MTDDKLTLDMVDECVESLERHSKEVASQHDLDRTRFFEMAEAQASQIAAKAFKPMPKLTPEQWKVHFNLFYAPLGQANDKTT